jgi:periplasmic protein TonB
MEDTLQPLEAEHELKPNKILILGIAASFLLHLVCALVLLDLPTSSQAPPPSVTYVDLSAPQHPAPMVVPDQQKAPAPVEPVPVPAPVPETPVQTQQPEAVAAQPAATAQPAAPTAAAQPKVEERSHSTMGLGLSKGYFSGLGDGETLRDGIKEYYQEMLQVINERWWMDQQLDKRYLAPVVVNITVARNGVIVGGKILRGSGNQRYDKAVLTALAAASPLPPLPASYDGEFFQAPLRLVPPLNLLTW